MKIDYLDEHMPYHFVNVDGVVYGYNINADELINEHDDEIDCQTLKDDIKEFLETMEVGCGSCSGSGEGLYDGTTCNKCKGWGTIKSGVYDD